MQSSALQTAIRIDHELCLTLLTAYRRTALDGDSRLAESHFLALGKAVIRHLAWEEDALCHPLRGRVALVHQHQVLQRDSDHHLLLRRALDRIAARLPERTPADPLSAREIASLVDALELLLDRHRTVFETQLVAELDGLLAPDEEALVAIQLSQLPQPRSSLP